MGANDDPTTLVPKHRLIGELVHRFPGLRLPRTNRPFESLIPAICEQKVTGVEARAAFRGVIARHGEPAPGPAGLASNRPRPRSPLSPTSPSTSSASSDAAQT